MIKALLIVWRRADRSLELPVAILPPAGLLLGLGIVLQNPIFLRFAPIFEWPIIQQIVAFLVQGGSIVFANLPLLFAISIAIGIAKEKRVAAVLSVISYLVLIFTMSSIENVTQSMVLQSNEYTMTLGVATLQVGIFAGLAAGFTVAVLERYVSISSYTKEMTNWQRHVLVLIGVVVCSFSIGWIMVAIWPLLHNCLENFAEAIMTMNPMMSSFLFGFIERLLHPFGLQHTFYTPFWFQWGEYITRDGHVVHGDQAIFFAQMKEGVPLTAGTFMTGKYPFILFGLPAVALAIYHEAHPEHRKKVIGILLSATITSVLTGITEPLEFLFLFVAPFLFFIHCLLAGISFMCMQILEVKIGMTFSGGAVDFILYGVIPNATSWWLVVVVGFVLSFVYYYTFRFFIQRFHYRTPGKMNDFVISERHFLK